MSAPPFLWGDWRATQDPRMWVGWCPACAGGEVWVHRRGDDEWRVSCSNGCSREQIQDGSAQLLKAQRERYRYEEEARRTVDPSDPFYGFQAERYVHLLTGQEPARSGFFHCPLHDDRTPSLHCTGILWFCHSCQRGGTIYDFGAALWNLEPRRDGFKAIRERLALELKGPRWT